LRRVRRTASTAKTMANTELIEMQLEQKQLLRNLLELYQHDLSEYDGTDVSENGLYGYEFVDHYWVEAGRHPFLIRVDGGIAGFVMVRQNGGPDSHELAEFFIMRKYRRNGVGTEVAHQVFDRFPGKWVVLQMPGNKPSQVFWRRVIAQYTGGNYREVSVPDYPGWPAQEFETR